MFTRMAELFAEASIRVVRNFYFESGKKKQLNTADFHAGWLEERFGVIVISTTYFFNEVGEFIEN